MKNNHQFLVLALAVFLFITPSCEVEIPTPTNTECEDGWGKLNLENKSLHTVQQILISGTNYGTLDPGESKTYDLPVGDYTLTMSGLNGDDGCGAPSEIHVPDCGSIGRSCSY